MKLDEAKAECERWLAYLDREKARSKALAELAADIRAGRCDEQEKRRCMDLLMPRNPTVFDGGNLEIAVRRLMKEMP